ncbi:MAG: glycosyltransferase family 2 protein [Chthoniobacterales bacterium]
MALGTLAEKALKQIVGIVLVRNEDRFVRQAVENALEFCDMILLVDNGSRDETAKILKELAASHSKKISFHAIQRPRESHELLKQYAGTPTWVFAVDGDEIYDSERLQSFRVRLLSGEFDHHWMILGNVHHCYHLDEEGGIAEGYSTPPGRSITKLYNFAAIRSWDGDTPERLHGGNPEFLLGYNDQMKRQLQNEYSWEKSPLRCLHFCFLSRSSLDDGKEGSRENIMETYEGGWTNLLKRFLRMLRRQAAVSDWKRERYARGERSKVSTAAFISHF